MKKLVAIIMALIAFFGMAYSETIDLDAMSVDELVKLRNDVIEALYSKNGAVSLPEGRYVAGKDIAAGTYTIVQCEEDTCSVINIYESLDGEDPKYYNSIYDHAEMSVTLSEGEVLDVNIYEVGSGTCPLIIFESAPLFMN